MQDDFDLISEVLQLLNHCQVEKGLALDLSLESYVT